jgi:hypothetical protein
VVPSLAMVSATGWSSLATWTSRTATPSSCRWVGGPEGAFGVVGTGAAPVTSVWSCACWSAACRPPQAPVVRSSAASRHDLQEGR